MFGGATIATAVGRGTRIGSTPGTVRGFGGGIGARLRRLVAGGAMVAGVVAAVAVPVSASSPKADQSEIATRSAFALTALRLEAAATTAPEAEAAAIRYRDLRKELATAVADQAAVSVDDLDAAWARADDRRMTAVLSALSQVGVPYSFGASEPGVGFDCSGLTSWAWGNAGITLEHSSYDQLATATGRDHSVAMAGDLTGLARRGHVAIYLGIDDLVVHAPSTGSLVRVESLGNRLAWFAYPVR